MTAPYQHRWYRRVKIIAYFYSKFKQNQRFQTHTSKVEGIFFGFRFYFAAYILNSSTAVICIFFLSRNSFHDCQPHPYAYFSRKRQQTGQAGSQYYR